MRSSVFCSLALVLLLAGCPASQTDEPGGEGAVECDGGCSDAPDAPKPDDPPPRCDSCHLPAQRTTPKSAAAPREWMARMGRGLTRKMPLMPTPVKEFTLAFVKRGHHPAYKLSQCADCHPVSSQGARHGMAQYPRAVRAVAFSGGKSCASGCHQWLGKSVTSTGFKPATGTAPIYKGSLRPHDLLTAASDGHSRIYRQGYVKKKGDAITIRRIKPGCAGCHSVRNDKHGTTSGCVDCHEFGRTTSAQHKKHVDVIAEARAAVDPGNAKATTCDYCHGLSKTPTVLKNAACYNCHLSGHRVLGSNGKPHFWPGK